MYGNKNSEQILSPRKEFIPLCDVRYICRGKISKVKTVVKGGGIKVDRPSVSLFCQEECLLWSVPSHLVMTSNN